MAALVSARVRIMGSRAATERRRLKQKCVSNRDAVAMRLPEAPLPTQGWRGEVAGQHG
jgi:hypothetical protein